MKTGTSHHYTAIAVIGLTILSNSSCSSLSRMSVPEKVAVILMTGGTAGTVLAYQSGGSAVAGAAGGSILGAIIPAVAAMVISVEPATTEQVREAKINAGKALEAMNAEEQGKLEMAKVEFLSVPTTPGRNARGKRSVMLYDIKKKTAVPDKVYDLRIEPKPGDKVLFDTVVSEYVGKPEPKKN